MFIGARVVTGQAPARVVCLKRVVVGVSCIVIGGRGSRDTEVQILCA